MISTPIQRQLSFYIIVTVILICGSFLLRPEPALAQAPLEDKLNQSYNMEQLETAIEDWINLLAQEQDFASWKSMTTWTISPLGPGTHGWAVIVKSHAKDIGHLIIHAAPDGMLYLTEYGTGENPLYSTNTLYQTMIQQELIPSTYSFEQFQTEILVNSQAIYHHPLEAFWIVLVEDHSFIIDAKTGEWYAEWDETDVLNRSEPSSKHELSIDELFKLQLPAGHAYKIKEQRATESFDVYEQLPWLTKKAANVTNSAQFKQWFKQQLHTVTYTTEILNGDILLPLPVIGLTQWTDHESEFYFVELDHMGSRYLPLEWLQHNGHFYENT
jgi:hypothetical protein